MKRGIGLLIVVAIALISSFHERLFGGHSESRFAFLGRVAPSGHSNRGWASGGGERTTFIVAKPFEQIATDASRELSQSGWNRVPLHGAAHLEYIRDRETLLLVPGRIPWTVHGPEPSAVSWTVDPNLTSVVIDRNPQGKLLRLGAWVARLMA